MNTQKLALDVLKFCVFFVLSFPVLYSSYRFTEDRSKSSTEESGSFKTWVRLSWVIYLLLSIYMAYVTVTYTF